MTRTHGNIPRRARPVPPAPTLPLAVRCRRRLLEGEAQEAMHPWYRGFNGNIAEAATHKSGSRSYVVSGTVTQVRAACMPARVCFPYGTSNQNNSAKALVWAWGPEISQVRRNPDLHSTGRAS